MQKPGKAKKCEITLEIRFCTLRNIEEWKLGHFDTVTQFPTFWTLASRHASKSASLFGWLQRQVVSVK